MISWEFALCGEYHGDDILESTPGFQGFYNTLIIASVQMTYKYIFRAKIRDDLICQSIF